MTHHLGSRVPVPGALPPPPTPLGRGACFVHGEALRDTLCSGTPGARTVTTPMNDEEADTDSVSCPRSSRC